MPATSAYLAVLRTTAAGLAARLGFILDDVEDLRIAIDEACSMLLDIAQPDAQLTCVFDLSPTNVDIVVSVAASRTELPEADTFAWTVLSALASEVSSWVDGNDVSIMLRKKRG